MLHVDDVAVLGEPINEGRGQMIIFQKGTPFAEAKVAGYQCGFPSVPLVHQGEEQTHLHGFGLYISDLVDQ